MITTSELRVGNWYYWNVKGTGKMPFQINERSIGLIFSEDLQMALNDFEPISLTKEILLGAGFVYVKNIAHWANGDQDLSYYKLNLNYGKTLEIFLSDGSCNLSDRKNQQINHVHEMQNLFHAITGREINIQL